MPFVFLPHKLEITSGAKLILSPISITRDKININASASSNSFNTGEACIQTSVSFTPSFAFGPFGNANPLIDDDLIDR